jgi:hypothetical protein
MPRRVKAKAEASKECMVCFESCTFMSSDLFLYNCTCVYAIHPECFKEWRSIGETSSICVICRESLMTFDEEVEEEEPVGVVAVVYPLDGCYTIFIKIYILCSIGLCCYLLTVFCVRPS